MGDWLYSTRLRWHGRSGAAKLHGKSVNLKAAPVICGITVAYVDYVPEIGLREIRRHACGRMEDMTDDEVEAADALLRSVDFG